MEKTKNFKEQYINFLQDKMHKKIKNSNLKILVENLVENCYMLVGQDTTNKNKFQQL